MSDFFDSRTGGPVAGPPVRLDGHADLPRGDRDAVSLDKLRAGGVNAIVQTLRADVHPASSHSNGLADLESGLEIVARLIDGGGLTLARGPEELQAIVANDEVALVLQLQNAAPIRIVEDFIPWIDRGVSIVGLTFIGNNQWAESSRPYPFASRPTHLAGLSHQGHDAIRLFNESGVIVDVSQMSDQAILDALDTSRAPLLASHSGLRRQVAANRNLSDDFAKKIAEQGGLIQIVAFGMYLRDLDLDLLPSLADLWRENGLSVPADPTGFYSVDDPVTSNWDADHFYEFLHEFHVILNLDEPTATVIDLVDAIESAIDLVGVDAVGISSDFNHGGGVIGWMNASETGHVVAELERRGHPQSAVNNLFGGNFLRLWNDVRGRTKS